MTLSNIRILTEIIGKTIIHIDVDRVEHAEEVEITCEDGSRFKMFHNQDCCETVVVEEVIGDIHDLIGEPLLMAEEVSQSDVEGYLESATWTFYKFATIKGYATIRWLGESNGYYSEDVDFIEMEKWK